MALAIAGVVVLVLAHVAALMYGASRVRLPVAIAASVVGLVVIVHLRLLSRLRDWIRRRVNE
jgi:hypothetical protein